MENAGLICKSRFCICRSSLQRMEILIQSYFNRIFLFECNVVVVVVVRKKGTNHPLLYFCILSVCMFVRSYILVSCFACWISDDVACGIAMIVFLLFLLFVCLQLKSNKSGLHACYETVVYI